MAKAKPTPSSSTQGMLLLDLEPESDSNQAAKVSPGIAALKPRKAERIETASTYQVKASTPPEASDAIEVAITVKGEAWTAQGLAIGEGGELLAEFALNGFVAAGGVLHSGWILAVNEVMTEVIQRKLNGRLILRIPDHRAVDH